jgi:hypothetical protein
MKRTGLRGAGGLGGDGCDLGGTVIGGVAYYRHSAGGECPAARNPYPEHDIDGKAS